MYRKDKIAGPMNFALYNVTPEVAKYDVEWMDQIFDVKSMYMGLFNHYSNA